MLIEERNIVVNDVWRGLLIVSSTEPIPDFLGNAITKFNDYYETIYYTDGLFRSFHVDGKYINWYLIRSTVVKEREVVALQEENKQLKAKVLAQEQNTAFLEDCIVEMAGVVYA